MKIFVCISVRSLASQEDKSSDHDQEESKAAEDRGKDSSKAAARRGGRQQLKEPRKKSPPGKSRSGSHQTSTQNVSPTPDVVTCTSDIDARCHVS